MADSRGRRPSLAMIMASVSAGVLILVGTSLLSTDGVASYDAGSCVPNPLGPTTGECGTESFSSLNQYWTMIPLLVSGAAFLFKAVYPRLLWPLGYLGVSAGCVGTILVVDQVCAAFSTWSGGTYPNGQDLNVGTVTPILTVEVEIGMLVVGIALGVIGTVLAQRRGIPIPVFHRV